jgi:hypothetical protein
MAAACAGVIVMIPSIQCSPGCCAADRQMGGDELVLCDCGCEYYRYASDITATWPVGGKFSEDQKVGAVGGLIRAWMFAWMLPGCCLNLAAWLPHGFCMVAALLLPCSPGLYHPLYPQIVYNAVLAAHTAVISAMKPGVSWPDMHLLANRTILGHLKAGGLLVGEVEEMMAAWLGALFMPHGGWRWWWGRALLAQWGAAHAAALDCSCCSCCLLLPLASASYPARLPAPAPLPAPVDHAMSHLRPNHRHCCHRGAAVAPNAHTPPALCCHPQAWVTSWA